VKGERIKKMKKGLLFFLAWLMIFLGALAFADEEYKFDLSEIEKKTSNIGGYLEMRQVHLV